MREQILVAIQTEQDGRGRDVSLYRHDEYRDPVYSISFTNEHGETVHSVLYWTREEAEEHMARCVGEGE